MVIFTSDEKLCLDDIFAMAKMKYIVYKTAKDIGSRSKIRG